jgi:hypothetical protein
MSNTSTSNPPTTVRVNGRIVEPGTELSIRGERGRFRFQYPIVQDDRPVGVTVYGGPHGHGTYRSFSLDRIRTVHRVDKLRAGSLTGGAR